MPPKDKSSKKTIEKEKARIVEDKTFGLKNKNKSKKVEKFIKSVQSQVANKGVDKKAEALAAQKKVCNNSPSMSVIIRFLCIIQLFKYYKLQ